jgi:hypothetical protein
MRLLTLGGSKFGLNFFCSYMKNDLYRQRFAEVHQQMESLLASQKSVFNELLHRNVLQIDSADFLEWKVKTKNLLNKACGQESEHYKSFCDNEIPRVVDSSLSILQRLLLRPLKIAKKIRRMVCHSE